MGRRLAAFIVLAGLLAAAPPLLEVPGAQGPSSGPLPRTPWGDPDLQGVWNNNTVVPLQRPADHAGREVADRRGGGRAVPPHVVRPVSPGPFR